MRERSLHNPESMATSVQRIFSIQTLRTGIFAHVLCVDFEIENCALNSPMVFTTDEQMVILTRCSCFFFHSLCLTCCYFFFFKALWH